MSGGRGLLVELGQVDARVVRLQNFFVRHAGAGHAEGADLAEADAVAPAAARDDEGVDAARLVVDAVDDEELFAQGQRGADASAADVRGAAGADDFEVDDAAGGAARADAQVEERADARGGATETRLRGGGRERFSPVRVGGEA